MIQLTSTSKAQSNHTVRLCPNSPAFTTKIRNIIDKNTISDSANVDTPETFKTDTTIKFNLTLANYYGDNDILTSAFDNTTNAVEYEALV